MIATKETYFARCAERRWCCAVDGGDDFCPEPATVALCFFQGDRPTPYCAAHATARAGEAEKYGHRVSREPL
jgi:hypothetical protein